jgi:hypothetical protein
MIKNKKAIAGMLVIGGMVAGAVGSVGVAVHAQSAPVVQATTTQVEPATANDPQDVPDSKDEVSGTTGAVAKAEADTGKVESLDHQDKNEVNDANEAPGTEVPDAEEAGN